ncbi:conserved hypothetical protein [Ricinus communis]|uniref:Uncharacterized protein n=1 Tax=Ricinus communis TaxID=3988 RepID=B9TMJ2_RICCO|nr:conserved hypothetical protein [Ricinus communis]
MRTRAREAGARTWCSRRVDAGARITAVDVFHHRGVLGQLPAHRHWCNHSGVSGRWRAVSLEHAVPGEKASAAVRQQPPRIHRRPATAARGRSGCQQSECARSTAAAGGFCMSAEKLHELEARKRLLLARSALLRLEIRHQVSGIRGTINVLNAGKFVARSAPVRSALLGLALSRLGHSRVAGLVGWASKAVLAGKIVSFALQMRRTLSGADEPAAPLVLKPGRKPVAPVQTYH